MPQVPKMTKAILTQISKFQNAENIFFQAKNSIIYAVFFVFDDRLAFIASIYIQSTYSYISRSFVIFFGPTLVRNARCFVYFIMCPWTSLENLRRFKINFDTTSLSTTWLIIAFKRLFLKFPKIHSSTGL